MIWGKGLGRGVEARPDPGPVSSEVVRRGPSMSGEVWSEDVMAL